MATEIEWVETPWKQPSRKSALALLEELGVPVTDGQYTIPNGFIDTLTEDQNADLTAFGIFGPPSDPNPQGKAKPDYSRFSGVTTYNTDAGFRAEVYEDGELLLDKTYPEAPDTVALWEEAHKGDRPVAPKGTRIV